MLKVGAILANYIFAVRTRSVQLARRFLSLTALQADLFVSAQSRARNLSAKTVVEFRHLCEDAFFFSSMERHLVVSKTIN